MRSTLFTLVACSIAASATAQYGTFDAKAVTAAKGATTLVVLDDGDSPYNRAITDAVKAHWKFTASVDFVHTADLATRPIDPLKNYLLKTAKADAEKHDAVFLTLVRGWKQKKGETITVEKGGATNIPAAQELAFIMIDANAIADAKNAPMLNVYVKNLQDYLKLVENGKITDKTTADRVYAGRNRLIKDLDLWVAKEHCDKSLPDAAKIQETYKHGVQLMDLSQLMAAASEGKSGVVLTDVVNTGDYKNMWCFRRVFNPSTGELMYQRDEAALFGKKLGFISEDFRVLEQSR